MFWFLKEGLYCFFIFAPEENSLLVQAMKDYENKNRFRNNYRFSV